MQQVVNLEFIFWQKTGRIFPYKSLSNIAMPNSIYKGLSSAPQILPAPGLLRRDGRKLDVRLLWKKRGPVPRAMGAGAVPPGLSSAGPWTSHHCESRQDRICGHCPWPCVTWIWPGRDVPGPAVISGLCQPTACPPRCLAHRGPSCLEVGLGEQVPGS